VVTSYLVRVFRATEDENRRAILSVLQGVGGKRLADLGCGDGAFTVEIGKASAVNELNGIELVPCFAEQAVGRGVRVAQSDLEEPFPFPDSHFDVVHSNQVIEHMRDTDHFMRESRRVLAPGGTLVCSTNNLASWHNIASLVLGWQPLPAHVSDEILLGNPIDPYRGHTFDAPGQTHRRLFTARGLAELAEYHGLRVREVKGVGYYPLPPRLARVATRLDGRHGAFLVLVATRD
jgi:SAM-dependent methyltransferase